MIRALTLISLAFGAVSLIAAYGAPEIRGRLGSSELIALDKLFDEVLSSEERRVSDPAQDIDLLALCDEINAAEARDFDAIVRRTQAVLDCEARVAATEQRIVDVKARVTELVAASCREITKTVRQCRIDACGSDPRLISIGQALQTAPQDLETALALQSEPLPEAYAQCLSEADQLCLIDGFASDEACLEARRDIHVQRFVAPIRAAAAAGLSTPPQSFDQ